MKYPVIVTPDAERELLTIYRYIRKQAPLAAAVWLAAPYRRLAIFRSGLIWRLKLPGARSRLGSFFLGRGNRGTYRILYTVIDGRVFVACAAWFGASFGSGRMSS